MKIKKNSKKPLQGVGSKWSVQRQSTVKASDPQLLFIRDIIFSKALKEVCKK
jgi:hypothetical protein